MYATYYTFEDDEIPPHPNGQIYQYTTKNRQEKKIMKAVEHAKISLPLNVVQRGDIIAPVYFSVTLVFYLLLSFKNLHYYHVVLYHVLVTCKLYDTRGHVSSIWCVGVSSKKTSLYNFHNGHSLITKIKTS